MRPATRSNIIMFKKVVFDNRGHPVYLSSYPAVTFRRPGIGAKVRTSKRFFVPLDRDALSKDANVQYHLEDKKDTACVNEPSPFLEEKFDEPIESDLVENLPKAIFREAEIMANEQPPVKFVNLTKKRGAYALIPTDEVCVSDSNKDTRHVEVNANLQTVSESPTKRRRKVKFRLIG